MAFGFVQLRVERESKGKREEWSGVGLNLAVSLLWLDPIYRKRSEER